MNDDSAMLSCVVLVVAPLYVMLSTAALASRYVPLLKYLASHGKTMESQTNWWSIYVPKRYFAHFYMVGLASLATFWILARGTMPWTTHILLLFHLLRRLYECFYVHQFRKGSKMHVLGYFLGVGHYLILPVSFVWKQHTFDSITFTYCICWIWNIWMQCEQYLHHRMLAEIRDGTGVKPVYRTPPNKRWFRRSFCPHYFAEIMIYLSWGFLLGQQDSMEISGMELSDKILQRGMAELLSALAYQRHWFLAAWVAINLGVSALNNRDWYLQKCPKSSRNALIPI